MHYSSSMCVNMHLYILYDVQTFAYVSISPESTREYTRNMATVHRVWLLQVSESVFTQFAYRKPILPCLL